MELPKIHASFKGVTAKQEIDLTQNFTLTDVVQELTRQRDYALACLQNRFGEIQKTVDAKKLLRFHLAQPIDVTKITAINNALVIANRMCSKTIALNPTKSLVDQVIAMGSTFSMETRDMVESARQRLDGPK